MNRQLDNKNWKESTTKYEDNSTIEITLITAANTKVKTLIKTTIKYDNDQTANAIIANRRMNIYKVIAVVARNGYVAPGMEMPYLTGKGITLPFKANISVHEVNTNGDSELKKEINLTSKVIGTDCLEITCEHKVNINGRIEETISHITFETKLPKYAYTWKEENIEEQKEEITAEAQEEQNVSRETMKTDTEKGNKNMKAQIEVGKIITATTHDCNRIKLRCINLFKVNGQATALFEIVGKEHLKVSVTIADKKGRETMKYITTNWKQVIKIIRNPALISFTKLEKIKVKLYNEETDKNDFEIRVGRKQVEFKDNRYFINSWESCNIYRLYCYIFYNRARVMKKAHKMIRQYKKHDINIPLSLAIKYYAAAEKVYMGTAKNEEEATKDAAKEIYQILNKEEKLIHYSIPYSCYKDQHFEEAIDMYGKYIDISEKEYNKETKCMDFVLRIKKSLMEYDNFIFESTYDKIMRCKRVIYREHLNKIEDELGIYKNGYGTYWEIGKREISEEKENKIKNILNKTLVIESYQTILDVLND